MKCPQCNSDIGDDSKLCRECGAVLRPGAETLDAQTLTVKPSLKDVEPGIVLAGRYRIKEKLGKGGMGTVYAADQIEPVRRFVAVKIIKLGMDTQEVIARFEAERQALAVMDHPNIAKVFDGGATDMGRPFFVMELVRGIPLTDYCDKHKLTTRERLELFIPICRAVQHAHQKGLIHRDLKPSNVLVSIQDGKPVPKVIDFGIAKAMDHRLTQQTIFTEQGQLIGTPEYMSPEQAEMTGLDIDTRTDIYTLGVMLYELLVGILPFDTKRLRSAAFGEIQRIIRETDPPKASTRLSGLGDKSVVIAEQRQTDPSSLRKQLRGDLDWIILRAMEKDRTRRYETCTGLAMDIHRYLHNEPVAARPPSTAYKMSKFAKRHKAGLAAGVIVTTALILSLVLATAGLVRARRAEAVAADERDRANQEAVTASQVSDFLTGLFYVSDPSQALGNTITAREILDRGTERIQNELDDQPLIKARLMDTMGQVYRNLGLFDQASALMQQALDVRRQNLGGDHLVISNSLNSLASLYYSTGRLDESEKLFREALEIRLRVQGEDHLEVSTCLNNLAMTVKALGRYDEAEPMYRRALEIRRQHHGSEHLQIANSLNNLGMFLYRKGELPEAEELFREALAMNRKLLGDVHPEVSANLNNLGLVLRDSKKYPEAEEMFRQVISMERKFYGDEHPAIARGLINLAALLERAGNLDEAEQIYREGMEIRSQIFSENHWETATAKNLLGGCLTKSGDFSQAEKLLLESFEIIKNQFGVDHPRTRSARRRVISFYEAWGKPDKAAEYKK
jgi:serine/threonine protein kinase